MNPYAKYLDGRPAEQLLAETAAELRACVAAIGAERLTVAPAPGKWSAAEIVGHMADCEIAHGFRLRQLLAEDNPTIQPFDQDKWDESSRGLPAAAALECFVALRGWTVALVNATLPQAEERTLTHPERGTMRYREYLEIMAGHDRNHLAQLRKLGELEAASL